MLKFNKKSFKGIGIYSIGYTTIKKIADCENIYSVNPLYLIIAHANEYIEEKGVNKYLVFYSTDENKELLKKYINIFNGIRDKIREISSGECDYKNITWKLNLILMITYH